MDFSYMLFVHHPVRTLAFVALMLAFISLWIYKKPWLWGSFLFLSFVFAFSSTLCDYKIFVALVPLCGAHLVLATEIKGGVRIAAIVVAILFSALLSFHLAPGFHNWNLGTMQISHNAPSISSFLNFDTPFIGFFPLALTVPLICSRMHGYSIVRQTILFTIIGIVILLIGALYLHIVAIDLKVPYIAAIWLIKNLFFVTIPEEGFFRGFLQRELHKYISTKWRGAKWGGVISIIVISLLFALLHIGFTHNLPFLMLTFVASIFYGTVYHVTRSIESAIFCHYIVNLLHFFCFTYPVLSHI